jgi:hypothetical protein
MPNYTLVLSKKAQNGKITFITKFFTNHEVV